MGSDPSGLHKPVLPTWPARRRLCAGGLGALLLGAARAEAPAAAAAGATPAPFVARQLRTGLFLLGDETSNAALRFSPLGSVMVDGCPAARYRPLMQQVRRLSRFSDHPVRGLVLTSHEDRHAGAAAQFLASGATIVAHRRVCERLPEGLAQQAKAAVPFVSFEREHTLSLAGVEIQLRHWGAARTDGDAVVHFSQLGVLAVGELFAPDGPLPDYRAGGSFLGWSQTLRAALEADFELLVPGHGPVARRADLALQADRMERLLHAARGQSAPGAEGLRALVAASVPEWSEWAAQLDRASATRLAAELAAQA